MNTEEQVITVKEACELLKLGKSKVYMMLEEGTLKGVRFGRCWRTTKAACDDLLDEQYRIQRDAIRR